VTLQFAEIFYTFEGARIFSIQAEGQTLISNLDLFASVGHDTAFDQTFTVTVTDGTLNLDFLASVDNPKVSAFFVSAPQPAPEPDPITGAFLGNDTGDNFFYKIQIEDPNGLGVPEILDGSNQSFVFIESGAPNDGNNNEEGDGYFVFASNIGFVIDQLEQTGVTNDRQIFGNPHLDDGINQLTYRLYVPEEQVGETFNFRFRVTRDAENFDTSRPAPAGGEAGDPGNGAVIELVNGQLTVTDTGRFSSDTQNDLFFSITPRDGSIPFEELLTDENSNSDIEDGFGRIFGGPTNSNFGSSRDGIVRGGSRIVFPEAGFYDFVIAGRAVGYHIDSFSLFRQEAGLPSTNDPDSIFVQEEDISNPPAPPAPSPEAFNLALEQPTLQSSTDFGGVSPRAVDGNTNGAYRNDSVTHTDPDGDANWWQVDLGQQSDIEYIEVWNRTDGSLGSRLRDFSVFVTDQDPSDRELSDLLGDSSTWQSTFDGVPGQTTRIPVNGRGRYVRIEIPTTDNALSLAEVIVFGTEAP